MRTPRPPTRLLMFQFTRPQGARHAPRRERVTQAVGFNSRARKGRDRRSRRTTMRRAGFNSRARKGRDITHNF